MRQQKGWRQGVVGTGVREVGWITQSVEGLRMLPKEKQQKVTDYFLGGGERNEGGTGEVVE